MFNPFPAVIGGWGNTKSAYLCDSSDHDWSHQVDTPNVVDSDEDRSFFVTFSNDTIEFGREGEEPFLIFQPSCSLDVKFFGMTSGIGNSADWTFCGYGMCNYGLGTIINSLNCVSSEVTS